jgi:hypothetical protein
MGSPEGPVLKGLKVMKRSETQLSFAIENLNISLLLIEI